MTETTKVKTLPGRLVSGYLQAIRLPLTAVERVAGQQENEVWPPALAYESFEAGVETVVGSVLRDHDLVKQGRLRQAKLGQLRKATELRTLAEQERTQAKERRETREAQVEKQRSQTERAAEQRKREAEKQAERQQAEAGRKAAKRAGAARQVKAAQDKAIERQERDAKASALTAESRALHVAQQALDAEETVDVIDETIEGNKAARQSG